MTINDRVRLVRASEELNRDGKMTMEKFGAKLGIQKSAVSKIEKGFVNVSEQLFLSICREFNVNPEWLRNGTGSMFKELSRNEQIDRFIRSILVNEPEGFKVKFIEVLSRLTEAEWKLVADMAKKLVAEQEQDEAEALHEELDRQLEKEKGAPERSEAL